MVAARYWAIRQLLLEGERQVELGTWAFELLVALVNRAGEVVSKADLMSHLWQGIFVDDSNVRVHAAAVRRALRDGQDCQRYVINIPRRGYSFVAPVQIVEAAAAAPEAEETPYRPSNLPRQLTRIIGRSALIDVLSAQLAQRSSHARSSTTARESWVIRVGSAPAACG